MCVSVRILRAPGQTGWVRDQLGVQQNILPSVLSSLVFWPSQRFFSPLFLALQIEPREKNTVDKKQGHDSIDW